MFDGFMVDFFKAEQTVYNLQRRWKTFFPLKNEIKYDHIYWETSVSVFNVWFLEYKYDAVWITELESFMEGFFLWNSYPCNFQVFSINGCQTCGRSWKKVGVSIEKSETRLCTGALNYDSFL